MWVTGSKIDFVFQGDFNSWVGHGWIINILGVNSTISSLGQDLQLDNFVAPLVKFYPLFETDSIAHSTCEELDNQKPRLLQH